MYSVEEQSSTLETSAKKLNTSIAYKIDDKAVTRREGTT